MLITINVSHHITIKIRETSIQKQKNVHFHLEMHIFSFLVCYKMLNLIDVWGDPIAIKLRNTFFPKMIKMNFGAIKNTKFPFKEYFKVLA
ncbi:hypothetical protein B5P40_21580 [Bacillus sp. SRB_8]|nr:hypothetical protein B5P40_21580 [Bacillus sp. SRB_8]